MSKDFYKNCLSQELREQVSKHLSQLVPEQLSLNTEVAIEKSHLADLVLQWSNARDAAKALEQHNLESPDPQTAKLAEAARHRATIAGDRMADAIKRHKDVVLTAATTEIKLREVLTERTLTLFLQAVMEKVNEFFNTGSKEDLKTLEVFESELRACVVVQQADREQMGYEGELWQMFESLPLDPDTVDSGGTALIG